MKRKVFRVMLSFVIAVSMLSAPQMAVFAVEEGNEVQTQVIPNDVPDTLDNQNTSIPSSDAADKNTGKTEKEQTKDEGTASQKPVKKPGASIKSAEGAVGIGDERFETLADAIQASKDGDTIKLYKELREFNIISGKKITIDLNDNILAATGDEEDRCVFKINAGAEVTVKNGTIKGGLGSYDGDGIINNAGKLTLIDMDFSDNIGELIKNTGTLYINDSEFEENDVPHSTGGQTYIVNNRGDNAKATIIDTSFEDNERPYGGIIYGMGNYTASKSKNEITLTGCDFTGNVVGWYGCISITYNSRLNLNDTTVKGNVGGVTNTDTAGLYIYTGQIHWNNSAIYGNDIGEGDSFADDIYVVSSLEITAGEIPLAKDMVDHGKTLDGYVLKNRRNDEIATRPINKSSRTWQEWTVCKEENVEGLAEYRGDEYSSIAKAVAAVDEFDSEPLITILKDAQVSESINGLPGLEIDLDGHTLSGKEKGGTILSISGGEATVKNGTIKGCTEKNNQKSALYAKNGKLKLENIKFEDNLGTAVRLYDPKGTATVEGCSFKRNGLADLEYCQALEIIGSDAKVSDCSFDGNGRALRFAESVTPINVDVENCTIMNSKSEAVNVLSPKDSNVLFKNCAITGTGMEKGSDAAIHLEAAGTGSNVNSGITTFEGCNIENNVAKKYTMKVEAGELNLKDCIITGNEAEISGAVYVDIWSKLLSKNTVIKENRAIGKGRTVCGGITMASAYVNVGTYNYETGQYEFTNAGFKSSSFTMEGGALYDNITDQTEVSADDLFVSKECEVSLFDPQEFKDGDIDFSDTEWKENATLKYEVVPAKKSDSYRYYTVKKNPVLKQIYIDGEKGDDSGDGTKANPIKTLARAMELAGENECKKLIISGTINVTKKRTKGFRSLNPEATGVLDTGGMEIKRDPGFSGYMISVASGSELTIKNTIIDGNARSKVKATGSLIKVNEGASLTLDDGAVLRYNGYEGDKTLPNYGGAIYSYKGDVTILPGSTIKNNYAIKGGGILADYGTVTMSGGLIDGNTALYRNVSYGKKDYSDSFGGGIALRYGAKMELSDGTISNNVAYQDGGGISLGDFSATSVTNGGTVELKMTGGTIDGNTAHAAGGGILVQCSTVATISGGNITNNIAKGESSAAYHAGGGIYVNGIHNATGVSYGAKHGTLYLTDVELTRNTAQWEGGAIAWCGTGTGGIWDLKGSVIYDNKSEGKAPYSWETPYYGDYEVIYDNVLWSYNYEREDWSIRVLKELLSSTFTAEYILNGAPYNWVDENGDPVDTNTLHHNTKVFRLNNSLAADDPDVVESSAMAKVRINGNRSQTNGGGIGANGNVYVGLTPEFVDIPVEKTWDDEGRENERFSKVKVDLLRDGKVVKSMILTEENGWKGEFKEQPKYRVDKDGNQTREPYEYTVREDMEYKPLGGMTVDECYTSSEELKEGTWVITNKPKDQYLPVTPPLRAVKSLDGKNPGDRQFTFELYDAQGKLLDSVKNNGEAVDFAPMEFTEPGDYEFTIKEKITIEDAIMFDVTEYKAIITVIRDGDELKSRVTYKRGDKELANGELPTFKNFTTDEDEPKKPDNPPKQDKPKKPDKPIDTAKVAKKSVKAYSSPTGDNAPLQVAIISGIIAGMAALGALATRRRKTI